MAVNGEQRELRIANWIVGGIAVIGAAVGWGVNQQSIASLEHRADSQAADIRANSAQIESAGTDIAVIKSEYADIKARLDEIDQKLDQVKR